ncbi:MAG: MraY family glycosyltransferase, partial [Candidatus Andersenbacteria bacterium]
FVAVYGILWFLLQKQFALLRKHHFYDVYYAGTIMIGVVSFLAYLALDDVRLRIGLLAVAFLTLLVGIVDEQMKLTARTQFVWQVVIAFIAVSWGWTVRYVSNPFDTGVFNLDLYSLGTLALPGAILAVAWLLFLVNAINWLDGADGLASGIGVIALITVALVSLLPSTQDSQTLTLALIGAGAVLGFLLWNFPPAKVYLGTTGSWFLGLYIGMIAIVGGGKIVTTLLVLALPVIDVLYVIVQRAMAGQAPWQGDTVHHLHHRLLAQGIKPPVLTFIAIGISIVLGIAAITLQTQQKIAAFIVAACMLALLVVSLMYASKRRNTIYEK